MLAAAHIHTEQCVTYISVAPFELRLYIYIGYMSKEVEGAQLKEIQARICGTRF